MRIAGLLATLALVLSAGVSGCVQEGPEDVSAQAATPGGAQATLGQTSFALQAGGKIHVVTDVNRTEAMQIATATQPGAVLNRLFWHLSGPPEAFASIPRGVKVALKDLPVSVALNIMMTAVPEKGIPDKYHYLTFSGTDQPDFSIQVDDLDLATGHIKVSWGDALDFPAPDRPSMNVVFHDSKSVDTFLVTEGALP